MHACVHAYMSILEKVGISCSPTEVYLNSVWHQIESQNVTDARQWVSTSKTMSLNLYLTSYMRGCGEKGTLLPCWWECKLGQPLWRKVWRFLKKLEIELPYDPAIPLLGIHTEETRRERDTCTPVFISALFIIARTWKQPRCPSADEWIRKQ